MKKGLVISWYFPPINSSEGLVTFKLLKNSKYEYDVFTQKGNEDWSYGSNADKLKSNNINTIFAKTNDINKWVEEGIEYFENNKDKYDYIMSRSMAADSHKIALEIKKRYPEVKWIASFGDPIADNPYKNFYRKYNPFSLNGKGLESMSFKEALKPTRIIKSKAWKAWYKRYLKKYDPEVEKVKLQRNILKYADKIILNNPYEMKHMLKTCENASAVEKKMIVIPHTYDKDFYEKKVHKDNKKIRMVYLGHCDDIRSPKTFLEALSRLNKEEENLKDKLIVEFYGDLANMDKARIIDFDLTDIVKFRKPVSYFDSLKIMQESDWVLLIDANLSVFINENIFFAAKIADYLGAGTNIFGITMPLGASADILRETTSIVSSYSADEIYMYLKQIVEKKCKFKTTNGEKYDIVNVVGKYDDMVNELVYKGGNK